MSLDPNSNSEQQITIVLAIAPEDVSDVGSTLVDAVRRDTIDALRAGGYLVRFADTGQTSRRGGELLFEVITFIENVAIYAWAHKDILGDLSSLIAILSAIVHVVKYMQKAYENRAIKNKAHNEPIKISVEIDDASIPISASDIESAENILKLAQRFQASHPRVASKVTTQSKIKVKGRIPRTPSGRRR